MALDRLLKQRCGPNAVSLDIGTLGTGFAFSLVDR